MSRYLATFTLPGIQDSPVIRIKVEAEDENQAVDFAFESAFLEYPQYGGFQLDHIEQVAA